MTRLKEERKGLITKQWGQAVRGAKTGGTDLKVVANRRDLKVRCEQGIKICNEK